MSSQQQYSFFQSVEKSFDKAAKFTKFDPGILEQIKACLRLPEAYRSSPRPSSPLCTKASTIHPYYLDHYRDWETDRKSTRLNSSHSAKSRMPSSA